MTPMVDETPSDLPMEQMWDGMMEETMAQWKEMNSEMPLEVW